MVLRKLIPAAVLLALAAGCTDASSAAATDEVRLPMPSTTVTAANADLWQPYSTCEEAIRAWSTGKIKRSDLIAGAVLIARPDGTPQFCEIPR